MEQIDVQELARELACRMAPDSLLDDKDVAALLRCSPRYVTERYATAPGFPKAIRIINNQGNRSSPRWQRSAVLDWVQKYLDGNPPIPGARRKN